MLWRPQRGIHLLCLAQDARLLTAQITSHLCCALGAFNQGAEKQPLSFNGIELRLGTQCCTTVVASD